MMPDQGLSRRHFGSSLFAIAAVFAGPFRLFAQPVPIPVLIAAAKAIVDAVKAAQAAQSQKQVLAKLDGISRQLNIVIVQQEQILSQLLAIRVDIGNLLQSQDLKNLQAEKDAYNALAAVKFNSTGQIVSLFNQVETTSSLLGQDQFPVFLSFCAGVAMLTVLAKLSGKTGQLPSLYARYKTYIGAWLDPSNPDSIATLIKSAKAQIDQEVSALNKSSGTYPYDRTVPDPNPPAGQFCETIQNVVVTGDINHQFVGQVVSANRDICSPPHGAYRPGGPAYIIAQPLNIVAIKGKKPPLPPPAPKPTAALYPAIPNPDATSPYEIVNDLVSRKNAVIQRMIEVNQYTALSDQMEEAYNSLSL